MNSHANTRSRGGLAVLLGLLLALPTQALSSPALPGELPDLGDAPEIPTVPPASEPSPQPDVTSLCPGGSASIAMTTAATHVFLPEDGAAFPLGRVQEGDTNAIGTLECDSPTNLSMKLDVSLLLPGGPNYTACLAVVDSALAAVLLGQVTPCGTLNQAALGTVTKFPWRGASASTVTSTCTTCTEVTPVRTLTKLAMTNNSNVLTAIALASGTLAGNGLALPPTTPITNLVGPATPPGIYHVEASFGPASNNLTTGKRYGEWLVLGAGAAPIPVPGCDGTQATEDGCLTKLLAASPTAPECVDDPNDPEGEICPEEPEQICIPNPEDPEGEPLACIPTSTPQCIPNPEDPDGEPIFCLPSETPECIEDPNDPENEICPPPVPTGLPACTANPPLPEGCSGDGCVLPDGLPACTDATGRVCVKIPFIGTSCVRPPALP